MPNLSGIQYLFTIPACVIVGLLVDIGMIAGNGWSWWLLAPPAVGFWAGIKTGDMLDN